MGYEVDFLPVGDGEKSGDAIVVRYGNLFGKREEQQIVVIDGGFKASGDNIVEHIQSYFKTDKVDLVVSTHPDMDHSSGLTVVLENMDVSELWMHQPWNHTKDIADLFKDGRITDNSVKEILKRSLDDAHNLETIAKKKNITIKEPFTGLRNSKQDLIVLGPSKEYYESLLVDFRGTPVQKEASFMGKAIEAAVDFAERVLESWDIETLDDDGETSAENNSSTIILLNQGANNLLFTSDAGIPALTQVTNLLDANNFDYNSLWLVQVPHHGSKRNVGPTILDKILGFRKTEDKFLRTSFVSVSKGSSDKHPSKKVTNAFRRRGAYVYKTNGKQIHHHNDAPDRKDWYAIEPIELFSEVED